jgi:predicted Zn-dependent protease
MPKQCKPGKTSTQAMGWHWNRNAQVKVYYLSGDFSEAEKEALSRAVNNWNDALTQINAHITFTVGGTLTDVSEQNLSLTVVRGIPRSRDRVGEVKLYSLSNGTNHVTVVIGPNVKSTQALTSLMTHEIGHSLGLADCYECRQGTTAMAAFHDMNKGNEVYEPSECDRYVVAAGYANERDADARIVSTSR